MAEDDDNCIVKGVMGGDDVLLNAWMFCKTHSQEYCPVCCRDHRMTNNVQLEDDLTPEQYEALTDYGLNDLADRPPLSAAGLWKTLSRGKTACVRHSAVGCKECFNFKKSIME